MRNHQLFTSTTASGLWSVGLRCLLVVSAAACCIGQSCGVTPPGVVEPDELVLSEPAPLPTDPMDNVGETLFEPEFKIDTSAARGRAPLSVEFTANTLDGGPLPEGIYTYDFGDGSSAEGPEVQHVFTKPGSYVVTLYVALCSSAGCSELDSSRPPPHANSRDQRTIVVDGDSGSLVVTPLDGLVSSGPQGGPFSPTSKTYTLENAGGTAIEWRANRTLSWISLSQGAGTLEPGTSTTVTVSINGWAETMEVGHHDGLVTFTNPANSEETTEILASLDVEEKPTPGSLVVTPLDGLVSSGPQGGPFSPTSKTYTLENPGATAVEWRANRTLSWISLSQAAGTLEPGTSTTVTVSINGWAETMEVGHHEGLVTFTNPANSEETTEILASLDVAEKPTPGSLVVTPLDGLASSGPQGGPFSPTSKTYTLENSGGTAIEWRANRTLSWISLSQAAGTLEPGTSTTVTVSINGWAETMEVGHHEGLITFANPANSEETTDILASLDVEEKPAPGSLVVTPLDGLVSSGPQGGSFFPESKTYTLENPGDTPVEWSIMRTLAWISLSQGTGSLEPGTSTTVTVSINGWSSVLEPGDHGGTVTFNDLTNAEPADRPVSLTVEPVEIEPDALSVSAGPDKSIVNGQAVTLEGSASGGTQPYTYSWSPATGLSSTTVATPTALPAVTTTYTLTVRDALDNTSTDSAEVDLQQPLAEPGHLEVSPGTLFEPTGNKDGPFTPGAHEFTLTNTGDELLTWTASHLEPWLHIQPAEGSMDPGGTATVIASITSHANDLYGGIYNDTITFTNTANGRGTTTRDVALKVMIDTPAIAVWAYPDSNTVTGTVHIGVVAYHSTGIDHVGFQVDEGPVTKVSAPTLNNATGEYEFLFTIDTTLLSNGQRTIRAVATPRAGASRTLPELTLDVANGIQFTTWYVDGTTGSDSYPSDGSSGNPWATITKACTVAQGGDRIVVGAGTYDLPSATSYGFNKYVTIEPAANATVTLSCVTIPNLTVRSSFLKFRGIHFNLNSDDTVQRSVISSTATHLWFDGCHFIGWGKDRAQNNESALRFYSGCTHVVVENCTLHDSSLGVTATVGHYIIRGNWMYDLTADGVDWDGEDILISNNTIHDNHLPTGGDQHCDFWASNSWGNQVVIRNNRAFNGDHQGQKFGGYNSPGHGRDGGYYQDYTNIAFINNQLALGPAGSVNFRFEGLGKYKRFRNIFAEYNTFFGGTSTLIIESDVDAEDLVLRNNIVYGGPAGIGTLVSGVLLIGNHLPTHGDPGFVSPETWDFTLRPLSPCRGAAIPGGQIRYDLQWNPRESSEPSQGAYE